MEYKDYYKILGVDKNATPEEIKKKYRRLARKFHPDVSKEKNAEEKFKEVREAYEVLKDPAKKRAYDQMGSYTHGHEGFTPPPGWEYQQSGGSEQEPYETEGFSEFFSNLFGHHAQFRRSDFKQRGQDLHTKIILPIEEAYSGTQRMIQLQEPQLNSSTGQIEMKIRTLNVKIPTGVVDGQQIRLAGQGGKGRNSGQNGDLYLEIQLAEHPYYTVKNRDVYLNCPVTPWEAALGAKIKVPTLAGLVELTIPQGSQTGSVLRLKNRGFPGNPAGNQYVTLKIYTPEPKNDQQRQIYREMANEMRDFNPREIWTRT